MHSRSALAQRFLSFSLALLLGLALAGCSSEASDRQTFIEFLQTRIIDKPGLHVPRPTPQEEKTFGEYNQHYAVILDFNSALDTKVATPMRSLMSKGMPRNIAELMNQRADLAAMKTITATLRTSIDTELGKADAARAALTQPADLKVVYDKAYARTVTEPAAAVKDVLPAVDDVLASAEKLAAHLDANKASVEIKGSSIVISDPAVLAQANVLMTQMGEKSEAIMAAQRKMNALLSGR